MDIMASCVLNIVAIGKDGVLRTPKFENALAGTTVRRVMELARRSLISVGPSDPGTLRGVSQERLTLSDASNASELFLCAGDTHLYPITRLEGRPVGDGRIGPVTKAVISLLTNDAQMGNEHHQSIHEY